MTEERIVERDDGVTHERVVERGEADRPIVVEKRGGGAGWAIALVLLVAVIAGIFFLGEFSEQEAVQTDAISDAAGQVGEAAGQVGDAAQDAAGAVAE